ncbi:hypothetical protein KUTeg_020259 [Tegillarca granosa]|uniref:Stabilin-2 n=1 Tax=Tegillarca granosa TaxID=220873 RepID=A0ABQ9ECI8_TEGGR|nr:hypothetical protein KUTeg_020259 [Tegillarca granosa]
MIFKMQRLYTHYKGNTAEITSRKRSGSLLYRYKLKGTGSKTTIVKGDILAGNGIVHVIGKLLITPPDIPGHAEKTMWQLIQEDGKYNRMQTLIARSGMEDEFAGENITVFAPNNAAWDELSADALSFLQSDEGRERLKVVLRNHIFSGIIDVMDLVNRRRIRSMAGNEIEVYVSPLGQIRLNGNVNISQTDIPAQNGLYYHVESVLLPDSLSNILPSFCDQRIHKKVTGPCSLCHAELDCPYPEDVPTDEISTECVINYKIKDAMGDKYMTISGCSRICNRTENVHRCCSGFYGTDCQPCRGGFKNPCNGNGQCLDGLKGDGSCNCNSGFTGPTCADCEDINMFGPNCTTPCTCKYGACDSGIKGSGRCRKNTCRSGSFNGHLVHYTGPDCDVNLSQCPNGNILSCPVHSNCMKGSSEGDDDIYQCVCQEGYEKIGEACLPIDPCKSSDRGGCHQQAKCVMINPGQHYCECEKGWVGNGEYCFPGTNCNKHIDCGSNAICKASVIPSDSLCTCIDGYHGNGTYCVPINMCSVNNGDCDPMAECTSTGPGSNKCTCGEDFGGDGYTCYASIGKLVEKFPDLSMVSGFLRFIPKEDNMLLSLKDNFTFFAPSNKAMRILIAKKPPSYWNKNQDNIINFIRFHTIYGVKTTQIMLASISDYGRYDTLYDGFKIHLYKKNNEVFVSSKQSNKSWSRIIVPNVPAFNGFIHIIDRALEPFFDSDDTPFLDEFFMKHPEYSMFGEWLNKKGLMDTLMEMDEYTLFVPSNRIVENFLNTTKITKDFLKYYILPNIRLSMSFENKETIETLLGGRHKLSFIVWTRQVFVNEVEIKKPDMLTDAGVVHGIDGPLVPTLHRCDEVLVNTSWDNKRKNSFILECPGGQEFPCNNNGKCNDGLNGTECLEVQGTTSCHCKLGYYGDGFKCDNPCDINNGGCHENATCFFQGSDSSMAFARLHTSQDDDEDMIHRTVFNIK